jgi:hypothetical protein
VPPPDAGGRDYRSVGFVLGGAGVVALGIGAYFGVRAWQKNDESSDHCDGDRCFSQTGVDLRDEARSAGNSSTVLSVAGGALLASGVTLVLLSPAQAESSSLHASAVADSTRATLSVGGTF